MLAVVGFTSLVTVTSLQKIATDSDHQEYWAEHPSWNPNKEEEQA